MKLARVQSRCECQARLLADLNEEGRVVAGFCKKGDSPLESAPALAIGAGAAQFQIGWLCPECNRNTVRSFFRGALEFQESAAVSGAPA